MDPSIRQMNINVRSLYSRIQYLRDFSYPVIDRESQTYVLSQIYLLQRGSANSREFQNKRS